MDNAGVASAKKRVTGSIKEAIGKLTGDPQAQAEGAAEKAEANAQPVADEAREAARKAEG